MSRKIKIVLEYRVEEYKSILNFVMLGSRELLSNS